MGSDSTGLRKIHIIGGDGERSAAGVVEPVLGTTARPCVMCKSFLRDRKRLVEHLISRGLKADENGHFVSPIAKDFKDPRANLKLDPAKFGFCQYEGRVVEDLATCPSWKPSSTVRGAG